MTTADKSTHVRTFGEATKPFTDAGIPASELLPLAPFDADVADSFRHAKENGSLGKAPGRYLAGSCKWVGLQGPHLREGLAEDIQREAQSWPTPNVGINGRAFPAVDADVGSELARRVVERAVVAVFGFGYAERIRGDGPRRLYALRSRPDLEPIRQVPYEKWAFQLPGEGGVLHKVDILGHGRQFVAAGTHPSGDTYGWREGSDLCAMVQANAIEWIERTDIDKLCAALEAEVQKVGGTWVRASSAKIAGGGKLRDYSWYEPIAPVADIFSALRKMPNTQENFPSHDDLVGVLAAIRAALGSAVLDTDVVEQVREWAVDSSEGYCREKEDFEKIWHSFRSGVRCDQNYLSRILADHNVYDLDFTDDAASYSPDINEAKAGAKDAKRDLFDRVADKYIFQHIDTSKGKKFQPMRLRVSANNELDAAAWYKGQSTDRDSKLREELHATFGKGLNGLFVFLGALLDRHPLAFYQGTTKNPRYEFGAVVPMPSDPGNPEGRVNLRRQSQAQVAARRIRKNPDLARADLERILDFVRRAFGDEDPAVSEGISEKFVLDMLAHMVQTGDRPGHMIYLVGDQGTGKSIFVEMLIALFDGTWPDVNGRINGAKLTNESARRFMLERTEGCRVVALQEMPKNAKLADQAAILSELKQAVDPGPGGDWLQVEAKNGTIKHIENHALVIVTTNYEKALEVEEQDRRTFYVPFHITIANKPDREFYARLVDITKDPERLAAFVQYLMRRDISGYRVTDAPPTSAEKSALQMAGISDDAERHMEVALRTLVHNDRWLFTQEDFVQLMNEAWRREGEDDSGPEPYSVGTVGRNRLTAGALKRLHSRTEKSAFKSGSKRYPTLYVLKSQAANAAGLQRDELFRALVVDRDERPLREMVPITPYRGDLDLPPIVEEAGADGADDEPGSRRSGRREGSTVVNLAARRRSGARG